MKTVPLIKEDFSILLVEDLGMCLQTSTSTKPIRMAVFKCGTCFNDMTVSVTKVKRGQTKCKSCAMSTHGGSKSPLYERYTNMISRCYNKKAPSYSTYGALGVTVCQEWLDSFESYREWCMSNGYMPHLQLDKDIKSAELGIHPPIYSPDTCKFVTCTENVRASSSCMSTNTSGYRGVSLHKKTGKYKATITLNDKFIHLGLWITALEAAKAYDTYVVLNNSGHTVNNVLSPGEEVIKLDVTNRSKTGLVGVSVRRNGFCYKVNTETVKNKYIGTAATAEEAADLREEYILVNKLESINKLNKRENNNV